MYGFLKLLYHAIIAGRDLLNVNKNALQYVPNPSKYFAMIMLACFWCLAFGINGGAFIYWLQHDRAYRHIIDVFCDLANL